MVRKQVCLCIHVGGLETFAKRLGTEHGRRRDFDELRARAAGAVVERGLAAVGRISNLGVGRDGTDLHAERDYVETSVHTELRVCNGLRCTGRGNGGGEQEAQRRDADVKTDFHVSESISRESCFLVALFERLRGQSAGRRASVSSWRGGSVAGRACRISCRLGVVARPGANR